MSLARKPSAAACACTADPARPSRSAPAARRTAQRLGAAAVEPERLRRVPQGARERGEHGVVRHDGGQRRGAEEGDGVGDRRVAAVEGEQLVNEEGGRAGRGGQRGDHEERVQRAHPAEDGARRGARAEQRLRRRGERRLEVVEAEAR
nr:unnamed protein product [Digitaria exilis]